MLIYEQIFRSVLNVKTTKPKSVSATMDDLVRNWNKLQLYQNTTQLIVEKPLVDIFNYIEQHNISFRDVPDFDLVKDWATHREGNEPVLMVLDKVETAKPIISSTFIAKLKEIFEDSRKAKISSILQEKLDIIRIGKITRNPITKVQTKIIGEEAAETWYTSQMALLPKLPAELGGLDDAWERAMNRTDTEIRWTVKDLLKKACLHIFYADGGLNKTTVLAHGLFNATKGMMIWDYFSVDKITRQPLNDTFEPEEDFLKVLYIEGDSAGADMRNLLNKFGKGPKDKNFILMSKQDLEEEGHSLVLKTTKDWGYLESKVSEIKPDILVLDPISAFILGDSSKESEQKVMIDALKRMAAKNDLSIILVDHSRKSSTENARHQHKIKTSQHDLQGSQAKSNLARVTLTIDRIYDEDNKVIENTGVIRMPKANIKKMKHVKFDARDFHAGLGPITYTLESEDIIPSNLNKTEECAIRMKALFSSNPNKQMSFSEIEKRLGSPDKFSPSLRKSVLRALKDENYIEAHGHLKATTYKLSPTISDGMLGVI